MITQILDEYRTAALTAVLEHKKASADSMSRCYAVETMRKFKTLDEARAYFEAEIKRKPRRGDAPREGRKKAKQ